MSRRLVGVLLLTSLAACGQASTPEKPASQAAAAPGAAAAPAWPLAITAVGSPAAPQVSLDPQITTSANGAIMSWLERRGEATSLKFATRTADGWSAPTTVASGRNWFVTDSDVPSVVRRSDGVLVASWPVKSIMLTNPCD